MGLKISLEAFHLNFRRKEMGSMPPDFIAPAPFSTYEIHQPPQIRQCRLLLVCTRFCTFTSAPWTCVYIPITRGRLSCVDVVDVDMLSAAEESKWILYEPVPSLDHSSNLTWTITKDQADTHTYLKKLTFWMAIVVSGSRTGGARGL